jgi:SAM-dependent methyltransferase
VLDFGNQWSRHGKIDFGYWTSDEMFRDHFENQKPPFENLKNKVVLEVGSGSGRVLQMLDRYNPAKLIGVEPSEGFTILAKNTSQLKNLTLIKASGDDFFVPEGIDVIFSFGVIHHIPKPDLVIKNISKNLKIGGIFILWVYGYENNQPYVMVQKLFKPFLRFLPDYTLNLFSLFLTYVMDLYLNFSKFFFRSTLPMTKYLDHNFSKCSREHKKYIIFDQINPLYSKYYKKNEAIDLISQFGLELVSVYHRHSYSWTLIAKKIT